VICEHAANEWCACIPRPPAHVGERVDKRGPGERIPAWRCECDLKRYRKHTEPWQCVPQAEIDAWRAISGCGPQTARQMYWLEKTFSLQTLAMAVK
jgi:hypothetical protein